MGIIKQFADRDYVNNLLSSNEFFLSIYPIGSIYISMSAISPSTFFGGVWEKIEGVFLLASDASHEIGSTGGEAEHTLTENEMPKHNHNIAADVTSSTEALEYERYMASGVNAIEESQVGRYWSAGTRSTGGSKPHNNMPPYLAVYMWKRVS